MKDNSIEESSSYLLAKKLGNLLKNRGLTLTTAESCSGGLLAVKITDIPGSSAYFDRGFITYSNRAKMEILGVGGETLDRYGAVSEQVAFEMAEGALAVSGAKVAIAITGIAGPTADGSNKPIGRVSFAIFSLELSTEPVTIDFAGTRWEIREQAAEFALRLLIDSIEKV